MSIVALLDGDVTRSWLIKEGKAQHVVELRHHTMTGKRGVLVDGIEMPIGDELVNVFTLSLEGVTYSVDVGYKSVKVSIFPHGATGFRYSCVCDGEELENACDTIPDLHGDPFVDVKIPTAEVANDALGEPVVFYRVDVVAGSRGVSFHKRFSEFVELNDLLQSAHKGSQLLELLPQFPQKSSKLMSNHRDSKFVHLRRVALQAWLQQVVCISTMRFQPVLLRFLGLNAAARVQDRIEVDVTFLFASLGIRLTPGDRLCQPAVVAAFTSMPNGEPGPAQACGQIQAGSVVAKLNGATVTGLTFKQVVDLLRSTPRPMTVTFLTYPESQEGTPTKSPAPTRSPPPVMSLSGPAVGAAPLVLPPPAVAPSVAEPLPQAVAEPASVAEPVAAPAPTPTPAPIDSSDREIGETIAAPPRPVPTTIIDDDDL